jgi:hypothetical protein
LVFNVCDNSVTVNGAGCGTFTLTNPGVGNACGAFSFTVNLCFTSSPTATFTQTAPTCTGATANNDGTITLTAATTATHYGVSLGATYTGPTTIAGATAFDAGADLPLDIITNAPNAGATYVVRIFNGADDCFVDETVVVAAVTCVAPVCDLGITTSAVCQVGETGKYDLTVTLNYTNSPGGTITVTLGTGETATSAATTASSNGSLMVTFTDLVNTGAANVTVDAAFNAAACSAPQATYTAPTDCCPAPLPLCPGESYTLTAETGWVNYQWFFDDGMGGGPVAIPTATNEIYATADQLGTYTWTAEDAMGCPVQTCCPIVLEAGVCAIYAIGSTVFADLNNSGTQDGTEVGVPNVPVQLWRVVGTKDLTPGSEDDVQVGTNITTNPQGNYLFADLPAGEYYVVIPDVAFAGALVDLSSSSTDIATTNADNGIDGDDNGIQMDGDGGFVMSPVIELGDAAGEPTGAAESFTGGTQDDAADDAAGDMTVDFGFFAPVAVCSEIFVDNNNNGIRDPGEPAIPSITLSVYTTGANGTAENGGGDDVLAGSDSSDPTTGEVAVNDLLPGVPYYLRVDMSGATRYNLSFPLNSSWTESPADSDIYYSGVQTARSTGNKNQCNPISGTFPRPGFFEPVAVGDYTWIDINEDGQQAGEPVLQGVLVTLYDATTNMPVTMDVDGNAVVPQETDVNGEYLFENLAPGSYYVVFDKDGGSVANPELYSLTLQDQGQDATDSDASPATGQSSATPFLESNEEDLTLDAGYRCAVDAEAGTGQTICSTAIVDLTTLGASITPATLGGTWATTGSGTFDGGGVFGTATTYTPSTADVLAGQVILTLTTNDPAALGSACPPVTDDVLIIILKVGCGTFPWSGN